MSARRVPTTRQALRVAVTDARGRPVSAAGLGPWLARAAPRRARGYVTIALVGDATMRRLNRQFRHIDRPTDVLSFPADTGPDLGEVAIALGVAGRQARALGHPPGVEIRVLALHGLLHLLGYDHDTDQGEMGRLEERLRRRAGLPSGLIARASGRVRHR